MEREELLAHTQRLLQSARNPRMVLGVYAEVCEFFRVYGGPNNSFLETVKLYHPRQTSAETLSEKLSSVLQSFTEYVSAGLKADVSPERRAQLDVVSDFLEMANTLIETKGVHPAAPAVLIGATLEEFL